MRGQYLIVEYIIFFAIGVGMIITVYFMFSNISGMFGSGTTEAQLKSLGEMITGTIINVFETSNSTNSIVYYNLSIPTKLSDCLYTIKVQNGLNLNCTHNPNIGVILTLYNFNINADDIIYSTKGLIEIKVENGRVDIK